jgi:hypothetical protein
MSSLIAVGTLIAYLCAQLTQVVAA